MSDLLGSDKETVDVIFPVDGKFLPRDHAQMLHLAVCAQWPQLLDEAGAGIHAIKLVTGTGAQAMLSRRARLLLRMSQQPAKVLLDTQGIDLQIDGQMIRLGPPHARALQPHTTLYAYRVAAANADEPAFMAGIASELAAMGVRGEQVCGKHQHMRLDAGAVDTFSLMLHGLAPEHSLRLQQQGLGPHRLFGCGLFIPHKSAAAV